MTSLCATPLLSSRPEPSFAAEWRDLGFCKLHKLLRSVPMLQTQVRRRMSTEPDAVSIPSSAAVSKPSQQQNEMSAGDCSPTKNQASQSCDAISLQFHNRRVSLPRLTIEGGAFCGA